MRQRVALLAGCLGVSLLAGCATIYNPATQREEWILIDTASEVRLGRQAAAQIDRQLSLSTDRVLVNRVHMIGARLAAVSDRHDLVFAFHVVDGEEINAFALPGGYIYLYSGLLQHIQSDDELANVIAHEIGHVAARHHVKQIQAQMGYQLLSSLVFRQQTSSEMQQAVGVVVNLVEKGYSRSDELEADRLGMRYAKRAGYAPEGMVSFFETLERINPGSGAIVPFLQTHPAYPQRIAEARQELRRLRSVGGGAVSPEGSAGTKSP